MRIGQVLGSGQVSDICTGMMHLPSTSQPLPCGESKVMTKAMGVNPIQIRSGAPKAFGEHTMLPSGNSCSRAGAKQYWTNLSFGTCQQRREGELDVWAAQVLHTKCPGS